jgi:hypothetical protein
MNVRDIQIRDPYVVVVSDSDSGTTKTGIAGTYYLFGSTDTDIWQSHGTGFDVYKSVVPVGTEDRGVPDTFEGPFPAFRPTPDFWSDTNFWAPEAHCYNGEWYLFATFLPKAGAFPGYTSNVPRKNGGTFGVRGTAILKSTAGVMGPYVPHSDGPVTPRDWECLDGTLFVDGQGKPHLVFCHEWQQIGDGEICTVPLAADLSKPLGGPVTLFAASSAPWAAPLKNRAPGSYVTDGPFLWRDGVCDVPRKTRSTPLVCLWSSFNAAGNYAIGVAQSATGLLAGPWKQNAAPLFEADGGHGMLFRGLDGKTRLAIHTPNKTPEERAVFIDVSKEDLCNSNGI